MAAKFTILQRSHPSRDKWLLLVDRYKAFRLLSLRLSPDCFGSTYAREAAFPPEKWHSRLSDPQATTIVAVEGPYGNNLAQNASPFKDTYEGGFNLALEAEWQASLVINGPLDPKTLALFLHLDEKIADLGPAHKTIGIARQYVINGMYVIPSARGKNLGVHILEYAKRFIVSETKEHGERARLSLTVDYDNTSARRVYEKCGFVVVHRYWFDDYREGREARTEAAVMMLDLDSDSIDHVVH
ncbi:hypothetical protein EsH8_III_000197 [Colletotrichum jinshuiense]